jgi:predicted metalloprotease with PDZ domain
MTHRPFPSQRSVPDVEELPLPALSPWSRRLLAAGAGLLLFFPAGARAQPAALQRPMVVDVDLTDAPRRLFHTRVVLQVTPGPLTLVYPKWIPGEHMPSGPVVDVAGLFIRSGGTVLPWRRDDVDMFSIRVEVPPGTTELEIGFDFLSPPATFEGFSAGASATANLALLSWNQVLVYPAGTDARNYPVLPSVKLPPGWTLSTALAPVPRPGGDVARTTFAPVSLSRLVDSPVLTGAHLREVPLGTVDGAPHFLALAAETAAEAELRPEQKAAFEKLILEAHALFGARHYQSYRFLTSISDSVAHFGLEHHQSSDDRVEGRTLVDPELFLAAGTLWSHEYSHSWNGKYRRPAGLTTTNFQEPMKGELLWVYEGLTEYLGNVLGARSGLAPGTSGRDLFALEADEMQQHRGRVWRPLEDTGVEAQLLYAARPDWEAWRRGVDFYDEGTLLWLEVDTVIREKTKGARSLDDFCRRFHGGKSGGSETRPFTFDELVTTLDAVVAHDWRGLLEKRLRSLGPDAPLQGLEASGWRLGYGPERSAMQKARETRRKQIDLRASIGIEVDLREGHLGELRDVVPESAAFRAGVGPAMRLVAVNGRKFSEETLRMAIARTGTEKLELLLENAETFRSYALDYTGGARYPRLERIAGKPDLLSAILAPRTTPAARKGQ